MSTTDTSQVESLLRSALTTRPHPAFPGAVAQIAVRGRVLPPVVVGDAVAGPIRSTSSTTSCARR